MKIRIIQKIIDKIRNKKTPELMGNKALKKLLDNYHFLSVLDLGAGEGKHSKIFFQNNKKVTAISGYDSEIFDKDLKNKIDFIVDDYLKHDFKEKFDCIWASHILEHQLNVGLFLNKIYKDLKDNGILAITVPPSETSAGGGHINCFTPGILIYHLVMAGFDLRQMRLKKYGYNLSIICTKNLKHKYEDNNYSVCLKDRYNLLPDYVIESIERYKKQSGGHERIEENLKYKW